MFPFDLSPTVVLVLAALLAVLLGLAVWVALRDDDDPRD